MDNCLLRWGVNREIIVQSRPPPQTSVEDLNATTLRRRDFRDFLRHKLASQAAQGTLELYGFSTSLPVRLLCF